MCPEVSETRLASVEHRLPWGLCLCADAPNHTQKTRFHQGRVVAISAEMIVLNIIYL